MSDPDRPTPIPSSTPSSLASPPKRSLKRILSAAVLVGGLVVSAAILIPKIPKERTIEIRVEDTISVTGIEVAWSESKRLDAVPRDDAPLGASIFRFEPGQAPKILRTTVHLPNGSYEVEILVERSDRSETIRRVVTLEDSDRITLPVR